MFKRFIKDLLSKEERYRIQRSVEKALQYNFKDEQLILTALVHRSVVSGPQNDPVEHNERLEFLGDSVLNFIMTEFLFKNFPNLSEGDLSKHKSILVSTGALADCSREINLGRFVQIGPSEEKNGGRDRTSILADLFEAVLGAMFLDRGIRPCKKLIYRVLIPKMNMMLADDNLRNYKSELLEALQAEALGQPEYRLVSTKGPEHNKLFVVEALIGEISLGKGEGSSKKNAQQEAAKQSLAKKAWLKK